ncbi:MAG: aldehyde dehydrogenase family protein [Solirubrobacterales bacterium]
MSSSISVLAPSTGKVTGEIPALTVAEVAAQVVAARAAQKEWEAIGFSGRAAVLKRCRRWMVDNLDEFIETIVGDTGKPFEEAQLEVFYATTALGYWAKHAKRDLADETIRTNTPFLIGTRVIAHYRPRGVIGVIGPWNVPLINSFGDAIPALAAGNAVVLKPSEVAPMVALLAKRMIDQCGAPENTFQVATGAGETGAALVDEVDFVHFTGSVETGRKVAARAIETLTPYTLELGGKDPLIVLDDAALERAANAAVYYSMHNSGQICMSIERAYVQAGVYDEFVALVRERVRALRMGQSAGRGSVDIGPMINPPQADKIEAHLADAVKRGATVLEGGGISRNGATFVDPTLLTDVDHSMEIMRDESFGPILPIMKFERIEEAIELANDTPYGLTAKVFTGDTERGAEIGRKLNAGTVSVNSAETTYAAIEVPMGGIKDSGIGARHGEEGIRKYCQKQVLVVTRFAPKRELIWFPYDGRSARIATAAMKLFHRRGGR